MRTPAWVSLPCATAAAPHACLVAADSPRQSDNHSAAAQAARTKPRPLRPAAASPERHVDSNGPPTHNEQPQHNSAAPRASHLPCIPAPDVRVSAAASRMTQRPDSGCKVVLSPGQGWPTGTDAALRSWVAAAPSAGVSHRDLHASSHEKPSSHNQPSTPAATCYMHQTLPPEAEQLAGGAASGHPDPALEMWQNSGASVDVERCGMTLHADVAALTIGSCTCAEIPTINDNTSGSDHRSSTTLAAGKVASHPVASRHRAAVAQRVNAAHTPTPVASPPLPITAAYTAAYEANSSEHARAHPRLSVHAAQSGALVSPLSTGWASDVDCSAQAARTAGFPTFTPANGVQRAGVQPTAVLLAGNAHSAGALAEMGGTACKISSAAEASAASAQSAGCSANCENDPFSESAAGPSASSHGCTTDGPSGSAAAVDAAAYQTTKQGCTLSEGAAASNAPRSCTRLSARPKAPVRKAAGGLSSREPRQAVRPATSRARGSQITKCAASYWGREYIVEYLAVRPYLLLVRTCSVPSVVNA